MLVEAPSQHSRPKNSALGSVNKGVMIEARGYCLPILSCTLSSLTIQFKLKLYTTDPVLYELQHFRHMSKVWGVSHRVAYAVRVPRNPRAGDA